MMSFFSPYDNHYYFGKLLAAQMLRLRNPLGRIGSRMHIRLVRDMLRIQIVADVSRN